MSMPAITVESLSKAYRIGSKQERFPTFRDALVNTIRLPFRRLRQLGTEAGCGEDVFWAIKDVSLEVQPGEVVGIIGRNGAGKSTLLKVLSRITEPTSGCARLRGRVASLLEVGTGFHPELTGRENIYLNGAILGMRKIEIDRKFDEIVAFSEVEKFLDTPVKHYSSGMYVRLAFAVAAHLEPEILIVDEVLAVGDAEFQKKCLGKMQEVSKGQGRTVLFVSHNMDAVMSLCTSAALLEKGRSTSGLKPAEAVRLYLEGGRDHHRARLSDLPRSTQVLRCPLFTDIAIHGTDPTSSTIGVGDALVFELEVSNSENLSSFECGVVVTNERRQRVVAFHSRFHCATVFRGSTRKRVQCRVPSMPLPVGKYYVDLAINDGYQLLERVENAGSFEVVFADIFGTGCIPGPQHGSVILPCSWQSED